MESHIFKKNIQQVLLSKGFIKKAKYFYRKSSELICVIGFQKSNYSDGYYINLGYIIKELNPNLEYPRDLDGDVRTRFSFEFDGQQNDVFELDNLSNDDGNFIKEQLENNIKELVDDVLSLNGIKELLAKRPTMLYQTKLNAKKFLGFDR